MSRPSTLSLRLRPSGALMSDRTIFSLVIALVFVMLSWISSAQPADKITRIGFLSVGSGPSQYFGIFVQRLGELGHVEGKNLVIEKRWAKQSEQLPELAAGLVDANVKLLVTGGTPATVAAKQTTATIPIVFIAGYPVEKGIIASLAHPGGNLTGIALVSQPLKPLERLKEAAPGIAHVALLYDPATFPRGIEPYLMSNRRQIETLNVTL